MHKHCPGQPADIGTMAEALHLETQYWENMKIAVANGIAQAFNGKE